MFKPTKPNFFSLIRPLCNSQAHDQAKMAATQIDSCTDPSQLTQIHAQMIRNRFLNSPFLWNSIMRCNLKLSHPQTSLRLFVEMSRAGISPDTYTLPITLKAASQAFALVTGRQLHSVAVKHALDRSEYSESGLISIYSKAGEFGSAHNLFDQNPEPKLGSWNAIISGLAQGGHSAEAVHLFVELRRSGLNPDDLTMVSVASACGSLGDLSLAEQVHKCFFQAQRLERVEVMRSNSLVDMYSKCGRTDLADRVFARMARRDVSTWTAMIMGLATHGEEKRALEFFRRMRQEDEVRPNEVTLVGVLSACAHGGLVDEGMDYLEGTRKGEYCEVKATVAHYGCVVDMLGRVGRVEEARRVVEGMLGMGMEANAVIWGTLLGWCEKHGSVEIGEWAAERLVELEPWNDGVYVVLSNLYAGAGMWEEVERVRMVMRERRVAKIPGYSLASSMT